MPYLDVITGLTEAGRKKAFSFVTSQPEAQRIEIIQDAVKLSFKLKDAHPNIPGKTIKYCALILAIRTAGFDTVTGRGYRVAEQEQFDTFTKLRKAAAAGLIQRGRTPVLRRKVLAFLGEVKELKESGLGFRQIAKYLQARRKLKVSPAYLAKMWKEVENVKI